MLPIDSTFFFSVLSVILICLVGWDEIFVKDMPFRVEKFFHEGTIAEIFPEGYVYSFIIRHPAKVIASLYNGVTNFKDGVGEHVNCLIV